MLSLSELKNYESWIGRNAIEVRKAAIAVGGWTTVFPWTNPFPAWASRVRNFFNETPTALKLLGWMEGWEAAGRANKIRLSEDFLAANALSGDVYQDQTGRLWYQMQGVGAVHHYKGKVTGWKEAKALLLTQRHVPVFKLISPDGTGGSSEICIHNPQLNRENWNPVTRGNLRIGKEGKWVDIKRRLVLDELYRGSYNYSETIIMGFAYHKFMDVTPHKAAYGFYINPPSGTSLAARRFRQLDALR